jgi:hypothetical protein
VFDSLWGADRLRHWVSGVGNQARVFGWSVESRAIAPGRQRGQVQYYKNDDQH